MFSSLLMAVVIVGLPPFVGWLTSLNMQQVGLSPVNKPQMESGQANSGNKNTKWDERAVGSQGMGGVSPPYRETLFGSFHTWPTQVATSTSLCQSVQLSG